MAASEDSFVDAELEERVGLLLRGLARKTAAARSDPGVLFELVMREEFTRKRISLVPHQRLIIDFVMAHPKCVLRAPVGFSKTYLLIALWLWLLGSDPTERGALLGAVEDLPMKLLSTIRSIIEESPELALIFPALTRTRRAGERWAQKQITVDRGESIIRDPSLKAYGSYGKLEGSRLSWILGDDLLTEENADPAGGERLFRWFHSTVLDRLDAVDSRIVVSNVPWNPKDLTFQLEAGVAGPGTGWASLTLDAYGDIIIRNTDWDSPIIRPANGDDPKHERHRLTAHDSPFYASMCGIPDAGPGWVDTENEVPLWPEKFPPRVLEDLRVNSKLGPHEFNRRYRCMVRDDVDAVVKEAWLELCKSNARKLGHGDIKGGWPGPAYTGVDPAFGLEERHNETALFTFAPLPSGHRLVLSVVSGRWLGGQVIDKIFEEQRKWNSIVCVEGNAAQRLLKQWANDRRVDVPVRTMNTGKNKSHPVYGLQSIFAEVEQGSWLFPNVDGQTTGGVAQLEHDLLYYEPGKHTPDRMMAMWIAREYARKNGGLDLYPGGGAPTGLGAALRR